MEQTLFRRNVLSILLLGFLSCRNNSTPENIATVAIDVKGVTVARHDIREYLTFNGVTEYQKKENIRANVTGYISAMRFKVGDAIRAGQLLAQVRTKEQDALSEAIKIDSSLAKFSTPLRIDSNSSGVISALNVQSNDYIAEGDVLAIVVQPKSLVVRVNVPYEFEDYIDIGSVCEILKQNGSVIQAKITGKLPIIDAVAQSQTFLIALPDEDLPENLNVQVRTIFREEKDALCIPHEALQTDELMVDFWVMKITPDSLAIKEKVIPLLRNDSLVQISADGIHLNDMVVVEGSYQMQDSTLISLAKR
jgi:biotin carboxyl carrier protein